MLKGFTWASNFKQTNHTFWCRHCGISEDCKDTRGCWKRKGFCFGSLWWCGKSPYPDWKKWRKSSVWERLVYIRLTTLYATLTYNEKCALKKLFHINANKFLSLQHILVIFHIDMGIILNKDSTSPSSVTLQNWATGWRTWPSSKLLCCVI